MRVVKLNFTKDLVTGILNTSITLDTGKDIKITEEQFAQLMKESMGYKAPEITPLAAEGLETGTISEDLEYKPITKQTGSTYKGKKTPLVIKKSVDEFGFEEG